MWPFRKKERMSKFGNDGHEHRWMSRMVFPKILEETRFAMLVQDWEVYQCVDCGEEYSEPHHWYGGNYEGIAKPEWRHKNAT